MANQLCYVYNLYSIFGGGVRRVTVLPFYNNDYVLGDNLTRDDLYRRLKTIIQNEMNATYQGDMKRKVKEIKNFFKEYTIDFEGSNELYYTNWTYMNASRYKEFQTLISDTLLYNYLYNSNLSSLTDEKVNPKFSLITSAQFIGQSLFKMKRAIIFKDEDRLMKALDMLEDNDISHINMPRNLIIFFDSDEHYNMFKLINETEYFDIDIEGFKTILYKCKKLEIF